VLGLWTSAHEGTKFWLQVLTELRNRGVKDICLACVDGLKGFPQAIESVFPQAQVQLCIVHLVRASLNYVNWKQRKLVAQDLKAIYRARLPRKPNGNWPSSPRDGTGNIQPSQHGGSALGNGSFRSSNFRPKFGESSTPPMPWDR
jgi:hypothetical protein